MTSFVKRENLRVVPSQLPRILRTLWRTALYVKLAPPVIHIMHKIKRFEWIVPTTKVQRVKTNNLTIPAHLSKKVPKMFVHLYCSETKFPASPQGSRKREKKCVLTTTKDSNRQCQYRFQRFYNCICWKCVRQKTSWRQDVPGIAFYTTRQSTTKMTFERLRYHPQCNHCEHALTSAYPWHRCFLEIFPYRALWKNGVCSSSL